uniref:Ycf21 n=1 Tax=Dasya naccarioides TaxID=2007180 RepID=A0A1Z1MGN7_9FLOR|nr:hypothetical protein [Dasya naccarioides]ARW65126.1 hypothetical protein [Dasya naccarioides]
MKIHIHTFDLFHYLLVIPYKEINYSNKKFYPRIPSKWQLILTNEGSFTQIIKNLSGYKINIRVVEKKTRTINNVHKNIRCVWLENSIYTKYLFARSIWLFKYLDNINCNIEGNLPIGNSLINSQTDIYKHIHEIYYGYSKNLEKKFRICKPIWGRKYTLYYKNKSFITIQEFFSPLIINFFS